MANPYLSSDESVILATDRILFRSAPLSALVLTNKRLLLIRAEGDSLTADEILLSKLRAVKAAAKETREPAVILTYVSESGDRRQETLAFTETGGISRADECGEWVGKLSEQIVPSLDEGTITRIPPPVKAPVKQPEEKPAEPAHVSPPAAIGDAADRQKTPAPLSPTGGILAKHDRPSGMSFPTIPSFSEPDLPEPAPVPAHKNWYIRIAAIALVILAVCAVLFLASQFLPARPGGSPVPATVAPVTTTIPPTASAPETVVTTPPVPTPAANASQAATGAAAEPSPQPALPTATTAPQLPVPDKGVWLSVQYAGKYTGAVEVSGARTPVEGTGDHVFQIVMKTGAVKAFIQKAEGSSDRLTVGIYRDGQIVVRDSTITPRGEVFVQADLKAPAPAPTIVANTTM